MIQESGAGMPVSRGKGARWIIGDLGPLWSLFEAEGHRYFGDAWESVSLRVATLLDKAVLLRFLRGNIHGPQTLRRTIGKDNWVELTASIGSGNEEGTGAEGADEFHGVVSFRFSFHRRTSTQDTRAAVAHSVEVPLTVKGPRVRPRVGYGSASPVTSKTFAPIPGLQEGVGWDIAQELVEERESTVTDALSGGATPDVDVVVGDGFRLWAEPGAEGVHRLESVLRRAGVGARALVVVVRSGRVDTDEYVALNDEGRIVWLPRSVDEGGSSGVEPPVDAVTGASLMLDSDGSVWLGGADGRGSRTESQPVAASASAGADQRVGFTPGSDAGSDWDLDVLVSHGFRLWDAAGESGVRQLESVLTRGGSGSSALVVVFRPDSADPRLLGPRPDRYRVVNDDGRVVWLLGLSGTPVEPPLDALLGASLVSTVDGVAPA